MKRTGMMKRMRASSIKTICFRAGERMQARSILFLGLSVRASVVACSPLRGPSPLYIFFSFLYGERIFWCFFFPTALST